MLDFNRMNECSEVEKDGAGWVSAKNDERVLWWGIVGSSKRGLPGCCSYCWDCLAHAQVLSVCVGMFLWSLRCICKGRLAKCCPRYN